MTNVRMPTTDDALRYLPGGVINTGGLNMPGKPTHVFSHGKGAYIYTTDGQRFVDMSLGSGTLLLGHCPPPVIAAVRAQLERGTNFSHLSPPTIELARMMVEAIPCAEKVRLFNSGSEALLYALRAVRAFTGKEKFLKFEGAYHGFGDPFMYNTNYGHPSEWVDLPQASLDTAGIPACMRDLVLVAPYNDLGRTRAIIQDRHAELAGIFLEPVMRGIAPASGFMEGVRELATRYHVPLVFDEVITGFRLAYGGAQAYYGVTPDLATFGKGMGAGYPIGAVVGSEELMSVFDPASPDDRRIYALGSFYGNALVAAAAVANLSELGRPGAYERLNGFGDRLRAGLAEIFARFGLPCQMTGAGSTVEFFFMSEPITDYRSTLRSNLRLKGLLGQELPRRQINGGGGRYGASTAHGDTELALMLEAVADSMQAIQKAGGLS
jgi:glutamate-1-semialdehyde 2,1-aminomutase